MKKKTASKTAKRALHKPHVSGSYTKAELLEDIEFLAKRGMAASSISFGAERDTGSSSNSIVAITYGIHKPDSQYLPSDSDDMRSCENMWKKMPKHRKKGVGLDAMKVARECNYYGKNKAV